MTTSRVMLSDVAYAGLPQKKVDDRRSISVSKFAFRAYGVEFDSRPRQVNVSFVNFTRHPRPKRNHTYYEAINLKALLYI